MVPRQIFSGTGHYCYYGGLLGHNVVGVAVAVTAQPGKMPDDCTFLTEPSEVSLRMWMFHLEVPMVKNCRRGWPSEFPKNFLTGTLSIRSIRFQKIMFFLRQHGFGQHNLARKFFMESTLVGTLQLKSSGVFIKDSKDYQKNKKYISLQFASHLILIIDHSCWWTIVI